MSYNIIPQDDLTVILLSVGMCSPLINSLQAHNSSRHFEACIPRRLLQKCHFEALVTPPETYVLLYKAHPNSTGRRSIEGRRLCWVALSLALNGSLLRHSMTVGAVKSWGGILKSQVLRYGKDHDLFRHLSGIFVRKLSTRLMRH